MLLPVVERIINDRLARVVAAVESIHAPADALHTNTGREMKVCAGCGTDDGNWSPWPCRTLRALDRAIGGMA